MTTTTPGASFHRGTSRQDYRTPDDFRAAVIKMFAGAYPAWDLAADKSNFFSSGLFLSESDDALTHSWTGLQGHLWLNPPFGNITPWAQKCYESWIKGAQILFLVPASVGSNWFQRYVHGAAKVYFLNPRLSFDGKNSFPKDMVLAHYGSEDPGYDCWRWK